MATRTSETASAGLRRGGRRWRLMQDEVDDWVSLSRSASLAGSPPMAVPMTVKIPEPMTAPMPSAVSETGPSVFFRAFSGSSESLISLSMDLVAKICLGASSSWSEGCEWPARRERGNELGNGAPLCRADKERLGWSSVSACSRRVPAFLTFVFFSPRAPVRLALGARLLACGALHLLALWLSLMLLVFAMNVSSTFLKMGWQRPI